MTNHWANLKGHNEHHPTKMTVQDSWEQEKWQRLHFGLISRLYADDMGI